MSDSQVFDGRSWFVLGFDGRWQERRALLDRAAAEAQTANLPLLLLTASRRQESQSSGDQTAAAALRALEDARQALGLLHPGLVVEVACLAEDDLARSDSPLRSAARLGLGFHGQAGRPAFEKDSVSRMLLGQVNCPVLLLPDSLGTQSDPGAWRRFVLVGVDRDAEDEMLIRTGIREAARRGLDVHVLHADPGATDAPGHGHLVPVWDLVRRAGHACGSQTSRVTMTLTSEEPVTALTRYARDAALLVVGTRPGSLAGLVADSVSHGILRTVEAAGCPVLVVPRPDGPDLFPRPPFEPDSAASPALTGRHSHE